MDYNGMMSDTEGDVEDARIEQRARMLAPHALWGTYDHLTHPSSQLFALIHWVTRDLNFEEGA